MVPVPALLVHFLPFVEVALLEHASSRLLHPFKLLLLSNFVFFKPLFNLIEQLLRPFLNRDDCLSVKVFAASGRCAITLWQIGPLIETAELGVGVIFLHEEGWPLKAKRDLLQFRLAVSKLMLMLLEQNQGLNLFVPEEILFVLFVALLFLSITANQFALVDDQSRLQISVGREHLLMRLQSLASRDRSELPGVLCNQESVVHALTQMESFFT